MPEPLDLARLEEFSDGTAAGLRELVRLLLEDSQETVPHLAVAIKARDAGTVRLLAHRFGGTCAACGARPLADRLLALEHTDPADQPALERLLDEIGRAHDEMQTFLAAYLEGRTQ